MILRCSGQLRFAPHAGIVVGLDLAAALALGAALGHDVYALAELLPAADAGLVAAINTRLSATARKCRCSRRGRATSSCSGLAVALGDGTEQDNVGGKGSLGGGSETKTRVYYRSFAVAICAGPITRLHRIWTNNSLIYDATVTPISNPRGAVIYPGSDSQDPDPVIEAAEGLSRLPATITCC